MFISINKIHFPLVSVEFGEKLESYEELDLFFDAWLNYYKQKKNFTFLLNTENCGMINIKYIYYLAKKIKEIKKLEEHFLDQTIVIIKSKWIRHCANALFCIIKPVAPVYLVSDMDSAKLLYTRLSRKLPLIDIDYNYISNK